ncbi:MAG TPA: hypothetical protein VGQ86_09530 [Candidatus Limnocylindria bacterium]|nr:hypothetical protein [Candidatus Limnocylindria bacterium]
MTKLHISPDLALPLDWMTLATVVYGARGSGKTTLGSVVAEEVTKAKQRFCAIDLKGDWYGLKSTADGKGDGIPVVVFGGDHQDVPLEEGSGAFIGETIAGLEQPAIIDLEYFSKSKQIRFLASFFETLYDRNRSPLLLLLDEAQRYAPQKPMDPESAKCLGAVEDLVKLGRKHGIGPTLFTQRGSGLNKEVSELCDMLVAFRTPGPLDQDRVKDWLDANTTKAQRDEVMGQLSGLPTGTAVFASGHPDLKVFGVYPVRRRETFDSSATPKVGHHKVEPKKLAKPDLEQLRARMAAAIERQKADDPKALRAKVAELEKKLAAKGKVTETIVKKIERLEVPVLKDAAIARLESTAKALQRQGAGLDRWGGTLSSIASEILAAIGKAERTSGRTRSVTTETIRPAASAPVKRPVAPPRSDLPVDAEFRPSTSQQRILDVLAWLAMVNVSPAAKAQVAGLAGQSPTSGGYFSNLGRLRGAGLIDYVAGKVFLTDAGRSRAVEPSAPPTNEQLHDEVCAKVSGTQARILRELIAVYPSSLTKDELAQRTGQSPTSGGYFNNLGRLRSLGFIEYPAAGHARAADILFIEAAA